MSKIDRFMVSRFDRYILSHLLALFGFFSLVLVAIYWINRAVILFDQLIGDGQSTLVFLEFSILTLPNVIKLVLPISAFTATVYGINRLSQESELVVMQATGFSAFRLARPVLYFGLCVSVMMLILMNVLVPASRATLALRSAELSQNATSRFLTDGQFMHPSSDITLYIRQITQNGELRDLFLTDDRNADTRNTYTASRALLVKGDSGPKLVMIDGMVQTLSRKSGNLSVTRFADFTYDLGGLITGGKVKSRTMDELATADLLHPTESLLAETGESRAAFMFEGHNRLAQPLLATAAALIGFSALLLGGFSRFGLWRQIFVAVLLMIGMQLVNTAAAGVGMQDANAWPLAYAAPIVGCLVAAGLLWWSQRPRRLGRKQAVAA